MDFRSISENIINRNKVDVFRDRTRFYFKKRNSVISLRTITVAMDSEGSQTSLQDALIVNELRYYVHTCTTPISTVLHCWPTALAAARRP